MINILISLNVLVIAAPLLHVYGTGIWDEVLAVIGTIALIIILIHMFFFDRPEDEPDETKDDNDKNRK